MELFTGRSPILRHRLGRIRSFKLYKSQLPVIERALETAALMLGASKSRGYCFEMICADFLAGAHLEGGNSDSLLFALGRLYSLLPDPQKTEFVKQIERV
jgi:hypothetical protein